MSILFAFPLQSIILIYWYQFYFIWQFRFFFLKVGLNWGRFNSSSLGWYKGLLHLIKKNVFSLTSVEVKFMRYIAELMLWKKERYSQSSWNKIEKYIGLFWVCNLTVECFSIRLKRLHVPRTSLSVTLSTLIFHFGHLWAMLLNKFKYSSFLWLVY